MNAPETTETKPGKLPAWSVTLKSGAKVILVRDAEQERNLLVFQNVGQETSVMISDAALAAVVGLAITKAGIPVVTA